MKPCRLPYSSLAGALLAFVSATCDATVIVQVQDTNGRAVPDAVVYAEPAPGVPVPKSLKPVEIEQKERKFLPLVTVVQAGTEISFPNRDTVRHHVYSFSPAKVFEIKLYKGTGKTEVFDKPGTVVIGCNIHDQMAAYIHVVPTPWFAKTDASGRATLDGLPAGKYQVKAWHHKLSPGSAIPEQAIIHHDGEQSVSFRLGLKTTSAD